MSTARECAMATARENLRLMALERRGRECVDLSEVRASEPHPVTDPEKDNSDTDCSVSRERNPSSESQLVSTPDLPRSGPAIRSASASDRERQTTQVREA